MSDGTGHLIVKFESMRASEIVDSFRVGRSIDLRSYREGREHKKMRTRTYVKDKKKVMDDKCIGRAFETNQVTRRVTHYVTFHHALG